MKHFFKAKGISLLELTIAAGFISGIALAVALSHIKASKTFSTNKQRADAIQLANAGMERVLHTPYPLVPLTPPDVYFPVTANPGGCDCHAVTNFSTMPPDTT